jgi:hypothetical protein
VTAVPVPAPVAELFGSHYDLLRNALLAHADGLAAGSLAGVEQALSLVQRIDALLVASGAYCRTAARPQQAHESDRGARLAR